MENLNILIQDLIAKNITMVKPSEFQTILDNKDNIDVLDGDIVECGCWRGGFSIFLAKVFPLHKIWVADSFMGFEPPATSTHKYHNERHTPSMTHNAFGPMSIQYSEVINNFSTYGLTDEINNHRVSFLRGFVKDTLNPISCPIQKIALLRIDVDAFSATLDVLEALYHKVVMGGYIIFDDSCLRETRDAIRHFVSEAKLEPFFYHPTENKKLDIYQPYTSDDSGFPAGCYFIKK